MSIRLRLHFYELPFRQPLRTAHGVWAERTGIWVRRESADGRVGWGEVAPIPGFGGGDLREAQAVLARLGETPTEATEDEVIAGGGPVAFALGMARAGEAAWAVDAPDFLPVAALLPPGEPALSQVEARLAVGFRTFKWKVGVADARDEQVLLDELLGRLPAGARVRLDANGGWERRTAERWLGICAERPMVEFVEQPCAAEAEDLLLGLASDYPVTLALDEAVVGKADFGRWRDLGWPGVYVIKPCLWGDPADIVATVRASGADVVISSGLETVVGARGVLATAFGVGASRALGTGVWPLFRRAGFEGPTAMPFVRMDDVRELSVAAVETEMEESQ